MTEVSVFDSVSGHFSENYFQAGEAEGLADFLKHHPSKVRTCLVIVGIRTAGDLTETYLMFWGWPILLVQISFRITFDPMIS